MILQITHTIERDHGIISYCIMSNIFKLVCMPTHIFTGTFLLTFDLLQQMPRLIALEKLNFPLTQEKDSFARFYTNLLKE